MRPPPGCFLRCGLSKPLPTHLPKTELRVEFLMRPQAVAHFERKGWLLRPCCYECSAKVRTAAAQQKQLERQRAANNAEQRRAPRGGGVGGWAQRKAKTVAPVSTVKKIKLKKRLRRRFSISGIKRVQARHVGIALGSGKFSTTARALFSSLALSTKLTSPSDVVTPVSTCTRFRGRV